MTVATELTRLINSKAAIKVAIEAKGVTVDATEKLDGYPALIDSIPTGSTGWTPPEGWIDISEVGDNEINLLVTEGTGIAFIVITSAGTYSIDWGDGVIENNRVSGTVYQHQHTTGGTPCNDGYNTWKVRIFGATGNITRWCIQRTEYPLNTQYSSILSAVFGTTHISDYSYAFYYSSTTIVQCNNLRSCVIPSFEYCTTTERMFTACISVQSITLPLSWGNVTSVFDMFHGCSSVISITLPLSWGNVTSASSLFYGCKALKSLIIPASWGNVSSAIMFFYGCTNLANLELPASWDGISNLTSFFDMCQCLTHINLPASWGNVNNVTNLFNLCYSLMSVTLPTSWGIIYAMSGMFYGCQCLTSVSFPTSMSDMNANNKMFFNCNSLQSVIGIEALGSLINQSDFTDFLRYCGTIQQDIVVTSLLKAVGIYGGISANKLRITSIRLTNSNSTFIGASPQVNVSYTSLTATALNLLFGDLPTLTGKTINITGCDGAATCTRSIATAKGWTVTG